MSHQPLSLEPSFLEMAPGFSTQQKPLQPPKKHPAVPPYLPLSILLLPQTQNLQPPNMGPASASDWIPPPALLATVNSDAIDLNDEVFFNYNSAPLYTTDPFSLGGGGGGDHISELAELTELTELAVAAALLLLLLMANFDYNYTASPFDTHRRRFLLAVEQLNRMSLRAPHGSLKLASPDLYGVLAEPQMASATAATEERTVNPRYLLGGNALDRTCHRGTNAESQELLGPAIATARNLTRYILPSSVLSPSLSTFFSKHDSIQELPDTVPAHRHAQAFSVENERLRHTLASLKPVLAASALNTPLNPYVMNDECVSAITYWLNNTADVILEKPAASMARTPTSVLKPGWARRNSIQVVSPRTDDGPTKAVRALSIDQKRRRRKSVNNSSIPEVSLPANLSLSLTQAQAQVQPQAQAQALAHFLQLLQNGDQEQGSFSITPQSLTLPLSAKQEVKYNDSVFEATIFDAMDVAVSHTDHTFKTNFSSEEVAIESNLMEVDVEAPKKKEVSTLTASTGPDTGDDEPKPFPCPDCEKQFKRLEHLKRHIRSVHSNIRPFHCKYCEKKFLRSDNLAQHLKTHFKVNANGTTTVIYGNPNPQSRNGGGRKKSAGDVDMEEPSQLQEEE